MSENTDNIKKLTARSLKWNVVDRFGTQILYAVTGIVLARTLSQEDFGLVGAILVFQAFASLFVDSGFSSALLQRKNPDQKDYSTVLWFNMAMACGLYVILFFAAPFIASCFDGDRRLIPLSRVMFLSFILSAASIVQTNRFMKQMNVRPLAVTNALALVAGGAVGIILAINGYGAWSLVWQTIVTNLVKTVMLWIVSRWLPLLTFSWQSLRSFFAVGSGVMLSSFLNTVFLNIYSFLIGNRVGLVSLGYYTQADKWSKMGIMSVSQAFTASFIPTLSALQDDAGRFSRAVTKINRLTSYIMFPAIGLLVLIATPVFHCLFDEKWDESIFLFQILLIRGIFTIDTGLYNNYILSLGRSRLIVFVEVLKDVVAIIGLVITFPYMSLSTPDDLVYGISIMLYGQLIASVVTWFVTMIIAQRLTGHRGLDYLMSMLPYVVLTCIAGALAWFACHGVVNPWLECVVATVVFAAVYMGANVLLGSKIQNEVLQFVFKKKR